tara:strand:+ start:58 stop:1593 length:1536 start_codon:yes stop_codon:yes gene_type:complete
MESKDIRELNKLYMEAVYGGGKKEEKKDTRLVVTAADKKANTKAYQNYKAGNKAYKAADHLKEDEKYGYDKDGNSLNPADMEEKKKKDDDLAGSPNKKGKKKAKRWWDDDGDGKGYEKGEVDGKFPKKKSVKEGYGKKKGHNCASKVKHEEYGIGKCIPEMHTILEDGTVSHYDVEFEEYIVENVPVKDLEILEALHHSHSAKKGLVEAEVQTYGTKGKLKKELKDLGQGFEKLRGKKIAKADKIAEGTGKKNCGCGQDPCVTYGKQKVKEEVLDEKESYKTVAAVIDYDRSKKGTDDATYDSLHGKKKAAKKERDYAAWERSKMKKDDPNWKHKKGSTSEEYDELDNELLQLVEDTLEKFSSDEILNMMESSIEMYESGWHRRNPGKKHPLESGSSKVKRRPVSDQEKKSSDKTDRMYVAMRRVTDKPISKAKSDAAGRLYDRYSTRQGKRKAGASSKEASAQSFGEFGGKDFAIKRGGRKGKAPGTDRGTGNKSARRAGQEVKNRDPRK